MQRFQYEGVDNTGEKKSGTIDAASKDEVHRYLRDNGIFVSNLKQVPKRGSLPQARQDRSDQNNEQSMEKRVPIDTVLKKSVLKVKVVDFDMDMGTMILFMVKWAIATIPAAIIIFVLFLLFLLLFRIMGIAAGV